MKPGTSAFLIYNYKIISFVLEIVSPWKTQLYVWLMS